MLVIKDLTLLETYTPGLHLIATLHSDNTALLAGYAGFKSLADDLTGAFDLQKLGEVYHDFEPGGFTGIICLSESHLSVHTWPEFGKVNLDIYLSNFQRVNNGTVRAIFDRIAAYFEAKVISENQIVR
ncbi:S-adenosylmethionine decarboxylase [Dyadobacter sp. BE34]|uniref:S-adenosylmethionine decarboxylase n=1 Tax=Dyadobacter fermentans TaxID=94254 RepID=A0ABU1QZL9_9BACT|nr:MULTISPECIES: S-adenosylmethionine decarboxylase [Dyadobacter]MDR6806608.1 S-adenosylmethionine decarboxylase [Dyadobacter fermentans]MDR7198660.1 S-adenosylmethionine decarboxylase [Dyadobacter sp. BE34]MDR7263852.1 S-adenosylmethionine decarboxylase [Dyadobacter sp. BE32]